MPSELKAEALKIKQETNVLPTEFCH